MKKKLLAMLLAVVMAACLLPGTARAATADPTEQQAYEAMIALKSEFPEGTHWCDLEGWAWYGGIFSAGFGCAGFAFMLSDAAFGNLPARMLTEFEYSDVRVGDILRINHDTHSVIVLEVRSDSVVIAEGNYNSSVHWGRVLTKAEVLGSDYMLTRYRPTTGTCGDNVTWSYSDGILTIEGTGPMGLCSATDYYGNEIRTIIIRDGVTTIDSFSFRYCRGLTSVTIPGSVTAIDDSTFYGCSSLTNVTISNGVTSIGANAFSECSSLTSMTIPTSVTSIGRSAFSYCKNLTSVTIPTSVTSISDSTFYGCSSLTGATIPASVTSIGSSAFMRCSGLTGVTIPDSVTYIGDYAFFDCTSLTDVYYSGGESQWKKIAIQWPYAPLDKVKIHFNSAPAEPETPAVPASGTAYPAIRTVDVDGKTVTFRMYALADAHGNQTNYIKIRDLALALNGTAAQFNIGWANKTATIETGTAYVPDGSENNPPFSGERPYTSSAVSFNLNGEAIELDSILLLDDNDNGHTYCQVKDLGIKLDFNVAWSAERGICIETNKPYTGN